MKRRPQPRVVNNAEQTLLSILPAASANDCSAKISHADVAADEVSSAEKPLNEERS